MLIGQIRRLAASEPVVFGIDTRLRTADALVGSHSTVAAELLQDAQAELAGVEDTAEQSALTVRLARAWVAFDLEQAQRIARMLRRGADHDYIAEAYDQLYLFFEQRPNQARQMVSEGLKAGAFRMISASRLLEEASTSNRPAAITLFSGILQAVPTGPIFPADVTYLLDQTKLIARVDRALAGDGIGTALRAAMSETLQEQSQTERSALLRRILSTIGSIDPELFKRYQRERKDLDLQVQPEQEPQQPQAAKDSKQLDIDGLSYSDALTQTRKLESLTDQIGKLIEISRREDLTSEQRTSVATEALTLTDQLPLSGDRLVGLAMIARDFARRNDMAKAALAAQMLLESYTKACDCGGAHCKRNGEEFDCLGNVEDFAEYLDEFKVSAESVGLGNISLDARLLVLKLKALLATR